MGSELYLRKVYIEIVPRVGSVKRIDGLRIQFEIEKNSESTPNPAVIKIYNVSAITRGMFEDKGTKIRLFAGYLGLSPEAIAGTGIGSSSTVSLLYVGDIDKVSNKLSAPDIITEIELKDGGNVYRNARLEKGYPRNVSVDQVVTEISKKLGLPISNKEGIPQKNYSKGLTLSGLVKDHLDMLGKTHGFDWSIQDETLQFTPKDKATRADAILLNPKTGLIGSPSRTDKGVEFQSLLQPSLLPGRRVVVESKFLKGTFVLGKVVHSGDSHQGDFKSSCECKG
jgi:hypothetical protein